MKKLLFLPFLIIFFTANTLVNGQKTAINVNAQKLFEQYDRYRESTLTKRRFKHQDIVPLVQALGYEKRVAGVSFEGREIYHIKMGTGKTPILLWSQMHGDESTATMALFDIFNFFKGQNDGFDDFRRLILQNCTLHFVPMLNPDGAERFQRRTATDIDMNRDALRLQTPEGVLLKALRDSFQPQFAFNLHDQGTRMSAGNKPNQATISFLATAYDTDRNWNAVRKRSMQVICGMNDVLQNFIPNHVAKYSDEHEPRAFGDNIQKWGSSLILIESGGYKDDIEKQFIRKLNFVAMLSAFENIAEKTYKKHKKRQYEAIPNNDNALFDLLVRSVQCVENGRTVLKDIGINFSERSIENATRYVVDSRVDDLGDLSTFWGIKELDAAGMTLGMPKDYPAEMLRLNYVSKLPQNDRLKRGDDGSFLLLQNGILRFVIVNGVVFPR
jgi:Zinc carboxypeptidase